MIDQVREDLLTQLDALVAEMLAAAGVRAPPVDAIRLAQDHLGMTVCLDRRQPQRGRAQRVAAGRHIYLRPEPTEERHQWTVAHEIGEHLRPQLLEQLEIDPAERGIMFGESLANLFANRLLVPGCWFAADACELDHDVPQLKERYRTASHEVVAWRLLDLPEPCVITIVDNDRVSRRRSNAWPVTRRLAAAEQECQRCVNRSGHAQRTAGDGWCVQGWPVHKPDWKREILRSVFEEW